ncbi:MAG: discoidin domain-containing protein [Candidatus Margulisiibacteriota bacterium]
MKKYLIIFVLLFFVTSYAAGAALTADTNLAIKKAAKGTFSNLNAVTDGQVPRSSAAVSGDISKSPQFLTVDLGSPTYIRRIKIFWDKDSYSNQYDVRVSSDKKSWQTELSQADAGTGVVDNRTGTISQTITGRRFRSASRYVQIYIPFGSKATAGNVKISEVQVFPAADQKIAIEDTSAYVVTDKLAIVTVKTDIGAGSASVLYGLSPDSLNQEAAIDEVGEVTSASLKNLVPQRTYFYKVRVWDYFGNMAESRVNQFAPAKANVALGKKVLGTFTALPPRDPYVDTKKDVLSRITDGGTSYFTAMATSRSVNKEDQYAIIDLGRPYKIDNVITYWRNLAYPQDFAVTVSNDNSSYFDGLEKQDAGKGAFSRSDAGDPMRVLKTSLDGVTARYIKVLIKQGSSCFQKHTDWDFVQLMEVKVIPR